MLLFFVRLCSELLANLRFKAVRGFWELVRDGIKDWWEIGFECGKDVEGAVTGSKMAKMPKMS